MKAITEELCEVEISAEAGIQSHCSIGQGDTGMARTTVGMERSAYLYVDAFYEKIREIGQAREPVVLVAIGITP